MHSRVTAAKCLSGNDAGMVSRAWFNAGCCAALRNSCLGSARPARGWPAGPAILRSKPVPDSPDARINSLFLKKEFPVRRN